jgi:hypothetical protein
MKIGWSSTILLIQVILCGSGITQAKHTHSYEQMHFSAEHTGVEEQVPIPEDVLAILRQDEMVRTLLEDEKLSAEKLPRTWFSASAIHLSNPGQVDLVVVGEGPILGANVTTFWVFCSTPHGHELVLTAPEHDLVVKRGRWKGYREIELTSATAVGFSRMLLRWDGRKYAAYREKSEHIQ